MIDFLVIGGGIAGLSAGARLSEHGVVAVLEGEDVLGYHASGRSAALFEERYGPLSVIALNEASAEYHASAHGGYLTPRGLMLVGGRDQHEGFLADCDHMLLDAIDPDQARQIVPILNPETVTFTAHTNRAQDIDTDRMLQDFTRVIRANGGRVLIRHQVTGLRKDRHWIVSAGEEFMARMVVNAAGAWVDQIANMAGIAPIGIVPCRRSVARLPAPGGQNIRNWPLMLGVGETWYAKPDAGKLLVSPAEADPVAPHDAYADDMVLAEGVARYEDMVTEPVTRVESNWAGLRSFAPDGTLVLGPDPADPSFVWSAAQGGYGFQTAPAASQLVADLSVGAQSPLNPETIAALSPARFVR